MQDQSSCEGRVNWLNSEKWVKQRPVWEQMHLNSLLYITVSN